MSLPELPNTRNPRELRKALLRLRMECTARRSATNPGRCSNRRRLRGMGSLARRDAGQARLAVGLGAVVALGFSPAKACAAAT
jgi:hypothetical protein